MSKVTPEAFKWQVPSMQVDPHRVVRFGESEQQLQRGDSTIPTAEEIEQWRQEAEAEGYAQGMKKAELEVASEKARLKNLINFLEHPVQALNEEVEQQLTQVAVSLAQQLVRRELRLEPGEIIGLIRDSVKLLPANSRRISILINPEDASLVRSALSINTNDEEQSWKLVEDPIITRGGCEIKTETSVINATLENRLSELAAAVLGGDRARD
ncbi:MAG: flagellar assembly protein FliH [Gammaproteobacteria bacterium]|nr:flagellar assembly protein FliH [Gammaproteobacteria bacterium]